VIVTVCGVFQLALVNVNVAGETVTSLVSADVAEITTSDVGCAANTTVKVPVVPASETVAVVPERVIPAGVPPPPPPPLPDPSRRPT
tara:strand:+ start:774 stop:1034 length:261 start_codon:yes stop_codon:yes gene_type:complete